MGASCTDICQHRYTHRWVYAAREHPLSKMLHLWLTGGANGEPCLRYQCFAQKTRLYLALVPSASQVERVQTSYCPLAALSAFPCSDSPAPQVPGGCTQRVPTPGCPRPAYPQRGCWLPAGRVSGAPARCDADKVLHRQGGPGRPGGVGALPGLQVKGLPVLILVLIRPYEVLLVLRVHPTVGVIIACAQKASEVQSQ